VRASAFAMNGEEREPTGPRRGPVATRQGSGERLGADGEPLLPPQGPLRRCVATRRSLPKSALVRLVVAPDGILVPDIEGRLPGRGLWITAGRDIVERAVTKRLFSRAAGTDVAVPPDLADRIAALLKRRCVELVGLARRAGQAVAGFEKVSRALDRGQVRLLLEARDGSPDQRRKVTGCAPGVPVVTLFTKGELGRAFGRETAVHVAVTAEGLAQRLESESRRLQGFLGETENGSDG
jgi:uncharacterized protein